MRIEYTGRQMDVTPDLRTYTEDRLGKLHRVLRDHSDVHVILKSAKHRRIAEITLTWRDHTLVGLEETSDPRSSINGALDKIERQAVRLLQRRWTRKRRSGTPPAAVPEDRKILITKRISLSTLSIEKALESWDLDSGDPLVFRNISTQRISVIYRRNDGRLVLIEPEP